MKRITLKTNHLQTISWRENSIIDWVNGIEYHLDGNITEMKYNISYSFDSAITSEDGIYAFIYKKLGTKGLLLKNAKIIREINRSFYFTDVYEYPAVLYQAPNQKLYLIHCPEEYCRIDIEDVETGKMISKSQKRKPSDFFHSRFEISPDNKTLISKGWIWHPFDTLQLFHLESCLTNPLLLDSNNLDLKLETEINTACFINNDEILIGSVKDADCFEEGNMKTIKPGQIAIWDIKQNVIKNQIDIDFDFGNLYIINESLAWDLYQYPKIINFTTGKIIDKEENIFSGKQTSSIIQHNQELPKIAVNNNTKQLAIGFDDRIEILTP